MTSINDIIASTLDAGDLPAACLAILAHPASEFLSSRTIERLYDFGANGVVPEPVDEAMIAIIGDVMRLEVSQ